MDFQKPAWVTERAGMTGELLFKVQLAAVYATPQGSIMALAKKIGCTTRAIYHSINRGDFTPGMALMIEDAAGRDIVKREELCSRLNAL